jgi:hypothetical protein
VQWNGGAGFMLFRARSDHGRHYWLKAAGGPNRHELSLSSLLAQFCPEFLPKLVATKQEWNAWLTQDAGDPLSDLPDATELLLAAASMARLQLLTIGRVDELLTAGAFDHRLPVLRGHIDAIVGYLIRAMARQPVTIPPPLDRDCLLELGETLKDTCFYVEEFGIPDTLIHNDLSPGNILSTGTTYAFADWSEAAVGNPLLSCERLCRLNPAHAEGVRSIYKHCWSHRMSAQTLDEAIARMPLLAIYAYLYGRGDWLEQVESVGSHFESYARSLARHMNRAATKLALRGVSCR